jgi:hypothetical protein
VSEAKKPVDNFPQAFFLNMADYSLKRKAAYVNSRGPNLRFNFIFLAGN